MRHDDTRYDPKPGVSIATLAWDYTPDYRVPEHAHASHQFIYATHGVMEVFAGPSSWLIPPQFAVWIPASTMHRIRMSGAVSMRTLYIRPAVAPRLPRVCTVFAVSPLLRELVLHAVTAGNLRSRNRLHSALRDLIVAQLEAAPPVPTSITMPADPRALRVANACMRDPSSARLHRLCERTGVSVRTIERAFRRETGVSFEEWRRQLRLVKAIEMLAAGSSVKEAAYRSGYRQPSAFVEMFRRTLGSTPKRWIAGLSASTSPRSTSRPSSTS